MDLEPALPPPSATNHPGRFRLRSRATWQGQGPAGGAADGGGEGPFENAVAAPDGEVWLRLYAKADAKYVTYLAVPRSGTPRQFRLETSKNVLAVGESTVYIVHEDEDGFTVLEWFGRMR